MWVDLLKCVEGSGEDKSRIQSSMLDCNTLKISLVLLSLLFLDTLNCT
jgi:hypothetical protein